MFSIAGATGGENQKKGMMGRHQKDDQGENEQGGL
jgi:hypothetical protein